MGTDPRDDDVLVSCCLAGDGEAWEALVQRYAPYAYSVLRHLLGGASWDVEDVLQEVFLRLYKSLSTFNRQSSFRTWFTAVARNVTIDHLRRLKSQTPPEQRPLDTGPPDGPDVAAWDASLEKHPEDHPLENLADILDLKLALAKLPQESRTILYLRFYRGLSCEEVARILGKPKNSVPVMTARALAKLRKLLASEHSARQKGVVL